MTGLANDLDRGVSPGLNVLAALAGIHLTWQARSPGEDASGVDAVELTGFGGRVEELGERHAVNREIVDGFVGTWWCCEGGGGYHGVDGFGVGQSKGLFL